jgi:undecaprenyl-diphosphatase
VFGGSLLMGILVQRNSTIQSFDTFWYTLIANGPHPALLNAIVAPFNFNFLPNLSFLPGGWAILPSYLYFFVLLLLIYLAIYERKTLPWAMITIFLGSLCTLALYEITSSLVFRARPFTVIPIELSDTFKAAWQGWTSFPSGHSRDTALYATIVAAYIPKLRITMLLFALFIAFSRVYLGAHYPTDVITGLLVGYGAAHIGIFITKKLQVAVHERRTTAQKNTLPVDPETADLTRL